MNVLRFATLVFLLCVLSAIPAGAQQTVQLDRSEIRFVGKQMNVPVEGKFRKFKAEVNFDFAKPELSRARIDIDLNSIDLGAAEGEAEVRRKVWFDMAAFPRAHFTSTAVKKLADGRFQVTGKLVIKGVSRDISVPFSVRQDAGKLSIAEGVFQLLRLDYKIGEGVWADTETVTNEVQVRFRIVFSGAQAVSH